MKDEDIEKFLNPKLDKETQKELEQKRQNDPEFCQEFDLFKTIAAGIKSEGKKDLKKHLQNLEQKQPYITPTPKQRRQFNVYLIGGVVAASLLAFALLWFTGDALLERQESNQLFTAYYQPLPNYLAPVTRSSEENNSQVSQAMQHYEAGRYSQAILLLETQLEEDTQNADLYFYMGMSLLANNQTQEAIKQFEEAKNKNTNFIEALNWYYALAHLKNNNYQAAKKELSKILQSQSIYQNKAQELLGKIK